MRHTAPLIPLFFLVFTLILSASPVHADSDVNFPDFPQQLADATSIPLFASQILCSVLFMFMWLLPLNATRRGIGFLPNLIVGMGLLGFCVAIGWMPYWSFLLICLIIASMWSNKMGKWLGK